MLNIIAINRYIIILIYFWPIKITTYDEAIFHQSYKFGRNFCLLINFFTDKHYIAKSPEHKFHKILS